ncbi:MAG: hypothetical protein HZA53_06520 [Planctomycetes bacterium]|nr:hypothetical protein [Planctomycetota bacterium]
MSGEFVLFLLFALAYTAAWWLVTRGSFPVVHVHVGEDEVEEPVRRRRAARAEHDAPPQRVERAPDEPRASAAPIRTSAEPAPKAWSLPDASSAAPTISTPAPAVTAPTAATSARPGASPPPAPVAARSVVEEPPLSSVALDEPGAAATSPRTSSTAIAPRDRAPTVLPERERAPFAPIEPMNAPNDSKNSNPLDFPNWMEETMNSRSTPATEAGPQPSASDAVPPTKSSSEPVATPSTSSTRSTTTPGGAGESLRGLSRIEKERMQVMTQLDTWARAWADVEKRNAQCVDELSRQVETLAQEHAQCDGRRRETEQRTQEQIARHEHETKTLRAKLAEAEPFAQQAKEQGARCAELDRDLSTARAALDQQKRECGAIEERCKTALSEMDKAKDHLARSQDATKEATARELDWQRRYHEDTGKLMQQLTAKAQESERWVGENQKQKSEIDKQTRDLRAKDELVQSISLRCSDLEQRSTTHVAALQEKDARLAELGQQIAELQKELAQHVKAEEEQSDMLQAAQGVLAELQPKLQQLEKKLSKH